MDLRLDSFILIIELSPDLKLPKFMLKRFLYGVHFFNLTFQYPSRIFTREKKNVTEKKKFN